MMRKEERHKISYQDEPENKNNNHGYCSSFGH